MVILIFKNALPEWRIVSKAKGHYDLSRLGIVLVLPELVV
jgi:hypothetical protein